MTGDTGRRTGIEDLSRFGDADHVPPGCLVGDTVDDLREMADDYAGMWTEFGPTDYSVASIRGADEMFASQQDGASWLTVELDDGRTGGFAPLAAQPACYVGEVMVRAYDADWVLDPDFGWALGLKGAHVINLFGTAHRALEADPPFVRLHDTLVENYDLDGEPIDSDGERLPERSRDSGGAGGGGRSGEGAIDPDEFDDEDLAERAREHDQTAAEMREFAADFVDNHSGYDLDYSVESLAAADAVVDDQYRTAEFADAELGGTDDRASLLLTAAVTEAGSYYGEVLVETTDAEWRSREDDGLKVEFPRGEAGVRVDPIATAQAVFEDGDSFVDAHKETVRTVEAIEEELDDL